MAISLGSSLIADSNIMDLLQREHPEFQPEQELGMENVTLGDHWFPQYLWNGCRQSEGYY